MIYLLLLSLSSSYLILWCFIVVLAIFNESNMFLQLLMLTVSLLLLMIMIMTRVSRHLVFSTWIPNIFVLLWKIIRIILLRVGGILLLLVVVIIHSVPAKRGSWCLLIELIWMLCLLWWKMGLRWWWCSTNVHLVNTLGLFDWTPIVCEMIWLLRKKHLGSGRGHRIRVALCIEWGLLLLIVVIINWWSHHPRGSHCHSLLIWSLLVIIGWWITMTWLMRMMIMIMS